MVFQVVKLIYGAATFCGNGSLTYFSDNQYIFNVILEKPKPLSIIEPVLFIFRTVSSVSTFFALSTLLYLLS